jgi:hypothetical protein
MYQGNSKAMFQVCRVSAQKSGACHAALQSEDLISLFHLKRDETKLIALNGY